MDNTKDNEYYLKTIISDLDFIIAHTSGKTKAEIESNELLIDSIMFRIIQIAENNGKLSDEFKKQHTNVPWTAIKGMRNRIVHNYGVVDMTVIYDTIATDIPKMREILADLI